MFKTNEYFDGKVKSIAFQGEHKATTVGVMASGDYVFNTEAKEKMHVITGSLVITFADTTEAVTFNAGESFDVSVDSSFNVHVPVDCAYLCEYG